MSYVFEILAGEPRGLVAASEEEFVRCWAQEYPADYRHEDRYEHHVKCRRGGTLGELTTEGRQSDLYQLLWWKANDFRVGRFWASVERVLGLKHEIAQARQVSSTLFNPIGFFWQHAKCVTRSSRAIVWPIFLCHVARPDICPIYDVHTWRAMMRCLGEREQQYLGKVPTTIATYFDHYVPLFEHLSESVPTDPSGPAHSNVDKALMSFGRHLQRQGR